MAMIAITTNAQAVIAETETDVLYFNFIEKGKVAELIQNPNKYKGTVIIPCNYSAPHVMRKSKERVNYS